jgi:hypothetical protein
MYPTKERGEQSKPRKSEREKFSVARAERKSPSRRREKDLMRRNCWGVGLSSRERRDAISIGMKTFASARKCAAEESSCHCRLATSIHRGMVRTLISYLMR